MHDFIQFLEREPYAIWLVLGLIILIFFTIRSHIKSYQTHKFYQQNDITNTDNQLTFLSHVNLKPQKLMNQGEYQLFSAIEKAFWNRGERVFTQVNLGEFLDVKPRPNECACRGDYKICYSCTDKARRSFNSKRVDILVVGATGYPKIAIEYQGQGHYRGNAAGRDAVKKYCFEKAGIHLVEVLPSFLEKKQNEDLKKRPYRSFKRKKISAHYFIVMRRFKYQGSSAIYVSGLGA
jgi:hypothetical protein